MAVPVGRQAADHYTLSIFIILLVHTGTDIDANPPARAFARLWKWLCVAHCRL